MALRVEVGSVPSGRIRIAARIACDTAQPAPVRVIALVDGRPLRMLHRPNAEEGLYTWELEPAPLGRSVHELTVVATHASGLSATGSAAFTADTPVTVTFPRVRAAANATPSSA